MTTSNIRVVLINTTHPGNIGATARAMKNMCLSDLVLVSPAQFPSDEASARASGADELLESARVVDSLDDAIAGCHWVVGTTARPRTIGWPTMTPRECAGQMVEKAGAGNVAIVFGRERMGLTNDEVDKCQALVTIPGNPEYMSLNVASAVQILAYEIHLAGLVAGEAPADIRGLGSASRSEEMERYYEHLEQVLIQIGFLDPGNPRKLMRRLRRLFGRAGPDNVELNILRGILTAIQQTEHWRKPE
ncbi:MAG: tRNA (cytosine(32)/uridine(32)-2'-O)-methyltransferase TrmJ [Acidiferrobacterales bacterium]|jgi:tRNA (cytidine32/uridine32-2'-O)-methyltransferase|nr:tRNA (cytosine(32)/uridine(32)-2'-O)-methyltransferase TrmJ [Acidiferrobacterales bacterium]